MKSQLTPEEERRAEAMRQQIKRRLGYYLMLRDNADTKKYKTYFDKVDMMILTGKFEADQIGKAVENESKFLQRFAEIDKVYCEVNSLINAYSAVFPEDPIRQTLENAIQDMRSAHRIGLSSIIKILEDRTEQLLGEIKKTPSTPSTP